MDETKNLYLKSSKPRVPGAMLDDKQANAMNPSLGKWAAIAASLTALALFSPAHAALSLVGQWTFNEGSGTTAFDTSGNNLNGQVVNGTYVPGYIGTAIQYNGTSSYVEVTNNALLNGATISISLWFKANSPTATYADLLDKGHYTPGVGYVIQQDGTGVYAAYGDGGGFNVSTTYSIPDNQWHFLAATLGAGGSSYWIDGNLLWNQASTPSISPTANNLYFGRHAFFADRYFSGTIDQARIFSGSFTQQDVNALYAEVPSPTTALAPLAFLVYQYKKLRHQRKSQRLT